jgi:6-phosphogluconolactonase
MSMTTTWQALSALALASAVIGVGAAPAAAKTFVYVSAAQDGMIDVYAMSTTDGALTAVRKVPAGKLVMPMAVSPNRQFLYAAVRSEPFKVITYAIDPATGELTQRASAPLPDSMPYVSTDATGRFLFTASYGGDKVAVSPINENGLVEAEAIQVLPTGRNAHAIRTDRTNRFVYVPNLGADQILQFRFDEKTGRLAPNEPAAVKTRAGHGPRHVVISPDNRYLYVLGELSGHVAQFAVDQATGTLKEVDSVASVPPESNLAPGIPQPPVGATPATPAPGGEVPRIWAADLQMTPNGKYLYATERNSSRIALFTIAPDSGKLTYVRNFMTEKQPRGIKIDPAGNYLVAAGEKSDRLAVYRINQITGELTEVAHAPVGNGANWVEMVELP